MKTCRKLSNMTLINSPKKLFFFFFFSTLSLLPNLIRPHTSNNNKAESCQRSCGDNHLPYPFGVSGAGCKIQLNCSATGDITVHNFPVIGITPHAIKIQIDPKCDRPINILRSLYTTNFAPTAKNAILLDRCDSPTPCTIPSIAVETHFDTLNCSGSYFRNGTNGLTCYSENRSGKGFLNFESVRRRGCRYLLSSILAESVNNSGMALDVQVAELGWWLQNEDGRRCSSDAECITVRTPAGRVGFRCECRRGFAGDGFLDGDGCRKAPSNCNLVKYMTGECGGTTRIAVLAGGIVAGASLLISVGLICCLIRGKYYTATSSTTRSTIRKYYQFSESGDITIPIYPYKEIERATNYFSEKQTLGTGAYGTVYAGKLQNDTWVAIKRIIRHSDDSVGLFMNEIKLISSVSHPNLIRLLGCSIDGAGGEQVLIYEFMPNGTLSEHLQREKSDGLSWPVRLKIAAETAQAIAYLHSHQPPIYHRDIKSSNILLDHDFSSKVADFGLSRLGRTEISHISTAPQGTPGYLDPQYHQSFQLSDKSDVYSLGVVMIEIITGLKVVDFSRPQNEVNLASLATDRIRRAQVCDIIDPFLEPAAAADSWTLLSIQKMAELAFRCLAFDRDMRPTMTEVAAELEQQVSEERPLSLRCTAAAAAGKRLKNESPVSIEDSWLSDRSSPSSNSLLPQ